MKAFIVKYKIFNYITLLYIEKESFKKVVFDRKENYFEKLIYIYLLF